MIDITLNELEVFVSVVDTGSLTGAAQQLDQTVSTVSRLLGKLEEKLGTTLLRRTTRRLDLTDEGCSFLTDARAIIAGAMTAQERLSLRRGQPSGPLRVDASTPFALHVLAPLVDGYRRQYPLVELTLCSNEGYVDLIERRIDVAIRSGKLKDSSLHSRLLCRYALRIVASPGYLQTHGLPQSVEDLGQHRLLGFSEPESLNLWPVRQGNGTPLHIHPDLASDSGEVLRQLALNGQGLACLGDFHTHRDRACGDLVEVLAHENTGTTPPLHAVYYRNTAESARISSFVDYLVSALAGERWAVRGP